MKKRVLTLLILTTIWGLGSWWYYTCKIKGFCDSSYKALNTNTTIPATTNTNTKTESNPTQILDSDADGLTDEEEIALETNPQK